MLNPPMARQVRGYGRQVVGRPLVRRLGVLTVTTIRINERLFHRLFSELVGGHRRRVLGRGECRVARLDGFEAPQGTLVLNSSKAFSSPLKIAPIRTATADMAIASRLRFSLSDRPELATPSNIFVMGENTLSTGPKIVLSPSMTADRIDRTTSLTLSNAAFTAFNAMSMAAWSRRPRTIWSA